MSQFNPTRQLGYNFSYERFEGNRMTSKITARNIRWVEDDTLYRLTDYFKRSIDSSGKERIESASRLDTLMPFTFEDLSPLNYAAQTLTLFDLNRFIAKEKESGSPLINLHLLVRHKRWSIMIAAFILTIIGVAVSSFKRRGGIGLNLALGVALAFLYLFFEQSLITLGKHVLIFTLYLFCLIIFFKLFETLKSFKSISPLSLGSTQYI